VQQLKIKKSLKIIDFEAFSMGQKLKV